jgi:hypothetical protein
MTVFSLVEAKESPIFGKQMARNTMRFPKNLGKFGSKKAKMKKISENVA